MMKRAVWLITILSATLLLISCSSSTDPVDEGPEYLDYSTPDNVIDNFVTAWNEMDIAEYRDVILYAGDPLAREEDYYAEFKFYFIDGFSWGLEDEETHTEHMFSGEPSNGGSTPGVQDIDLFFSPSGDWQSPDNPYWVEGHTYPEGTVYRNYQTDLTVSLNGTVEGTEVNVLLVRDIVRFYVIPLDDGTGYRLWKWMDVGQGLLATEEGSWSSLKALW
jgi:hypothetical protein